MRRPTLALLLTPKDSDLTFVLLQKAIFAFPIDRLNDLSPAPQARAGMEPLKASPSAQQLACRLS